MWLAPGLEFFYALLFTSHLDKSAYSQRKLLKKTEFPLAIHTFCVYLQRIYKSALHLTMLTTYGTAHNEYWNSVQNEITMDDLFI